MAEVGSAFVSLLPSARGFGSKMQSEIGGEVDGASKSLGSRFGKMFALAGGALAAAGIGSFLKDSIGEAREAQKVSALTEQIIKSTGGAAKISAAQVGDLATAISNKTGIDDEAIQSGANLLLTFKNVRNEVGRGNDVFNRATQAATDLSAAGFGDLSGASKQLGKALNDPIKGMSALARSGVTFTEGQQTQIKALVEGGNVLKAQKIILAEVESQVGGAAAASATAGEKAAVAFGNLKEQIGTALLPVIDSLANTFTTRIVPAISSFVAGMQSGAGIGGQFAAAVSTAFGALKTLASTLLSVGQFVNQHRTAFIGLASAIAAVVAVTKVHTALLAVQAAGGLAAMIKGLPIVTSLTKAWAAVQWLMNAALAANPLGIVVIAIAAFVAAIVIAWKKSDAFKAAVIAAWNAIKSAAVTAWNAIKSAIDAAWNAIKSAASAAVNAIKSAVSAAWEAIKAVTTTNLNAVKTVVTNGFNALKGVVTAAWGAIKAAVQGGIGGVVDLVRSLPGKMIAALGSLGSLLFNAGAALIQGLVDGITSKISAVTAKMSELASKVKGFLPGSPVKEGPLKSWNNGGAGKRLVAMLAEGMDAGGPLLTAASTRMASRVASPAVSHGNVSGGASLADLAAEMQAVRATLERMPKSYMLGARQGAFG